LFGLENGFSEPIGCHRKWK